MAESNEKVNSNELTITKKNKDTKIAKPPSASKPKALIYLGPNIPKGLLQEGNVYSDYPEHLISLYENIPETKKLFVDVAIVVEAKSELKKKGSEMHRLYQKVLKDTRSGGVN